MSGYSGKQYYLSIAQVYVERIRALDQLHPTIQPEQWRWLAEYRIKMTAEPDGREVYRMCRVVLLFMGWLATQLHQAGYSYHKQASSLSVTNTTVRKPASLYRAAALEEVLPWEQGVSCVKQSRQSPHQTA